MSEQKQLNISIKGMTCEGCARKIGKSLSKKPGVFKKNISWSDGRGEIIYNPEKVSKDELVDAVNRAGHYQVTGVKEASGNGEKRYDLVVIGGGSAAFAAAIRTGELGGKALIINKGLPTGGTCVNVGCVPSKTLIRSAEAFHKALYPRFEGIESRARLTSFKKLIDQKREMVEELRKGKYIDVIQDNPNITLMEGSGRFIDEHTVDVDGTVYHGKNILIATGASAYAPEIPGLEEAGYLTNESAYELDKLPDHLVVIGGGYIALENAQLFSRLGSKVTIIQRSSHILSDQSEELARGLTGYLEDEGITVLTNTRIINVSEDRPAGEKIIHLIVNGKEQEFRGSDIFVATGRKGNTGNLNLETIGVETVGEGYIPVDETMRTSVSNIFAAGDVIGDRQFVYTAAYEGNLAATNAMRRSRAKADFSVLPWVIFTDPQVAGVGMDEQQAKEAGIDAESSKLPLEHVPRSIAARDTRGYIKLIRNKANDRLAGARILAPEGSELLMELALAIRHGVTVESLKSEFHPYLTLSEGIKLAALTFDKDVKKLSCCAV